MNVWWMNGWWCVRSWVTKTKCVLVGRQSEVVKSNALGSLRAGWWKKVGWPQLLPQVHLPNRIPLFVMSPNNGAKMSSLPACGFSGRQPDLSPVSAQSQLLALSRTTLSPTSTGKWPIGSQRTTETSATRRKKIDSRTQKEMRTTKISKCLLKCLQNITLSQQSNAHTVKYKGYLI